MYTFNDLTVVRANATLTYQPFYVKLNINVSGKKTINLGNLYLTENCKKTMIFYCNVYALNFYVFMSQKQIDYASDSAPKPCYFSYRLTDKLGQEVISKCFLY